MALISCENISLAYEGKTIVSDINFKVNKGDYLCIAGENGSGKTTLMKALLGLKKPASGKIIFGDGLTKKDIGYLPQQTEIQRDFPASVKEIVMSGCVGKSGLRPFYSKTEKMTAEKNMEILGIKELSKKCYRELSGGQQQRVLLARALCATEKLLILDEPVAGLDPVVTGEMYSLIDTLNKKHEITVIMVSHDISETLKYASHVLHIGNTPLFYGTSEDYLKSPVCRTFTGSSGKGDDTK